jgi:hypothetical protein
MELARTVIGSSRKPTAVGVRLLMPAPLSILQQSVGPQPPNGLEDFLQPSAALPKHKSETWLLAKLGILTLSVLLAGCGTTSNLKPVTGANIRIIQKYSRASVLDFGDKANAKTETASQKVQEPGRHFADLIALALENSKAFEKVTRGTAPQPGSLSVSGDITRCVEGSSSLRFWIGMGAGSSYFDATVQFADADTGEKLGEILVDKNSWALGGGIAAGQTIQSFMEAAAKKIAAQVAKAKADAAAGK